MPEGVDKTMMRVKDIMLIGGAIMTCVLMFTKFAGIPDRVEAGEVEDDRQNKELIVHRTDIAVVKEKVTRMEQSQQVMQRDVKEILRRLPQ